MNDRKALKVIFTDLDGTLLDYFSYSYKKAVKGLKILWKNNVPLILVSSKTISEMIPLHKELKLQWPLIFENGGGIAYPNSNEGCNNLHLDIIGENTENLKEELTYIRKMINTPVKILSEMDIDEIIARTGLSKGNAMLAARRMTSIPFVLTGSEEIDLNEINEKLKERRVFITMGGRFYHLSSLKADKGYAVRIVIQYLMKKFKVDMIESIALGDSENDIPMLKVADRSFLVRRHDGSVIDTEIDVKVTKGIGPAGFTEAVKSIF